MSDNQNISARLTAWAAGLLEDLPPIIDASVEVLREAKPEKGDVLGAERSARAVGVVARSARAVMSLLPKGGREARAAKQEEDGMNPGDESPEVLERLRDELESRLAGLRSRLEHKGVRVEPGAWPTARPREVPLRAA